MLKIADTPQDKQPEIGIDPKGHAGSLKAPLHLLPPSAMAEIARAHAHGAGKYGAFNWRASKIQALTYAAAMMRHLDAWRDGEDCDPESGVSHLAHIGSNCNILLDCIAAGTMVDNRFKMIIIDEPDEELEGSDQGLIYGFTLEQIAELAEDGKFFPIDQLDIDATAHDRAIIMLRDHNLSHAVRKRYEITQEEISQSVSYAVIG
jgi:hypothetical protein